MNLNRKIRHLREFAFGVAILTSLGGVETPHSNKVIELAQFYAENPVPKMEKPEVMKLTCLETEGKNDTVGIKQSFLIHASLESVAKVVEDIPSYSEIFPDLKVTRIDKTEGDRIWTFWEQKVPVFFIPNIKYRMIYETKSFGLQKKIYRYQLEKASGITKSDGIIVIEKDGENTRYLEYDFFEADWGVIKAFVGGKIWSESVKGTAVTDFAFKIRAEQPKLSLKDVKKQAQNAAEQPDIEKEVKECISNKIKIDMKRPLP